MTGRQRPGPDDGTIIPLILGCVLLAALVVLGAVAASSAFLAQRDLAGVCDGAAVAAAQAVDEPRLYAAAEEASRLPLGSAAIDAAIGRYLAAGGYGADPAGLVVRAAPTARGQGVVVRCTRTVSLPFGSLYGYPNGLPRTAVATADAPLRPPG